MHAQRGNFLLQALLALALVFAFVPMMARQMADRDSDARMYATTQQIELASRVARIFIRENAVSLPYDTTILAGRNFTDTLEPYGLPIGFSPKTALGQDITLIITKDENGVAGMLQMTGGNLSALSRAELARRIGFYASTARGMVVVGVALGDAYSDIVRRNETDIDAGAFMTDLDMGGFNLENVGNMFANVGDFETAMFDTLNVSGTETGRKERNQIAAMDVGRAVFQTRTGESALNLTRGTLSLGTLNARTLFAFGDAGNLYANAVSAYDFSLSAGRNSFYGPHNWNVRGNLVTSRITFSVERLDVSSYINVSRGQDVYISPDDLEYSTRSGIAVDNITTSNITLRDQTSSALSGGASGLVLFDLRPAGTSVLPDALVDGIDNGAINILSAPGAANDKTEACRTIITDLYGRYNAQSLSQYLICQYMFWMRLEQRINLKQCMLNGGGNCE